jgi:uncharacterized protein YbbC (DUF1343 family)
MVPIKSGLDVLIEQEFRPLRGKRVGLVTHPAAVDRTLRSSLERFAEAPLTLSAIFGPEHGLHGQAQDLIGVTEEESKTVTRVVSLYGKDVASLRPSKESLEGLDVLVIDLQDIGTRFYTFQATMLYCMQVALPMGLPVMILDRHNPLGGMEIEGPVLRPGYESFVGAHNIPVRHGMTIGELALFYADDLGLPSELLQVVRCEGWERDRYGDETCVPWVMPSPNMPTLDTALVYPGQCLFEGTLLSEGRGTTRPFEICGAPWIDATHLAKEMNAQGIPGVYFRPICFRPTFQKHANVDCGGVQIHVLDRECFRPVRVGLALLQAMRRQSIERFRWRTEIYEFVESPIAIDLLFGSSRERLAIEADVPWKEIAGAWEEEEETFRDQLRSFRLYR